VKKYFHRNRNRNEIEAYEERAYLKETTLFSDNQSTAGASRKSSVESRNENEEGYHTAPEMLALHPAKF